RNVTGVQTCALPISLHLHVHVDEEGEELVSFSLSAFLLHSDGARGPGHPSPAGPRGGRTRLPWTGRREPGTGSWPPARARASSKIGRASCRERGEIA